MEIVDKTPFKQSADRPLMLWCSSHFSLASEEIPLYLQAGFRIIPLATDMWTFQYQPELDHLLCEEWKASVGLSADVIAHLQAIRMYDNSGRGPIAQSDLDLLNRYVDVVYLTVLPNLAPKLASSFQGSVVFRPFGHVAGMTYSKVSTIFGTHLDEFRDRYNYIWCPILSTLQEPEDARVWANPLHVGCFVSPQRLGNKRWKAGASEPVVIDTIPRIGKAGYYFDVYQGYVKDFGDLPLRILGGNSPGGGDLLDSRIVGQLDDEQYQDRIISGRLAIYHGRERTHLHYHPIEYMTMGVPVLFHTNSALAAEARTFGLSEAALHEMGMYSDALQAKAMAREGLSDWRVAAQWSERQKFFITEVFDRQKALNQARWLRTVCTCQLRQMDKIIELGGAVPPRPTGTLLPPSKSFSHGKPADSRPVASGSDGNRRWPTRVRRELIRFSQKVRGWAARRNRNASDAA